MYNDVSTSSVTTLAFKLLNSLLSCMPYSSPNTDNLFYIQQENISLLSNNSVHVLGMTSSENCISFLEMVIGVKVLKVFPKPMSFLLYTLFLFFGILAALCLWCSTQAFSSCGSQLWSAGSRVREFTSCNTWAFQLWRMALSIPVLSLVAPWHVGSQLPDQGLNPCPLHWKRDS